MPFFILFAVILVPSMVVAIKLSPWTERMMSHIWMDPTRAAKLKVAKRVKELCIDGNLPEDKAAAVIAAENNLMEEEVKGIMKCAGADPAIMRMAMGSKVGGMMHKFLKKLGTLEE